MLSQLFSVLVGRKQPQDWNPLVEALFSKEEFLPPLHTPNILPELRLEICRSLEGYEISDSSYSAREEVVLNTARSLLEERMKTFDGTDHLFPLVSEQQDAVVLLYKKVEQLMINRGYQQGRRTKAGINMMQRPLAVS